MKHLIFLDIDGTLIQPNQRPNTTRLPSIIKRLSRKGVLFALNSNRSFEDVVPIYKKFLLNGPIILENGVYYIRNSIERTMLVKNAKSIQLCVVKLSNEFVKKNNMVCKVLCTDTTKIVKSKNLSKIPLIILINGYRKYTASIHIYRYGSHDKKLAKKLARYIRKYFIDKKLNFVVENPESFGNIVVFPKGADKGLALKKIKKYYRDYAFYMVGDDVADLKTLREINSFFAVGNAHEKVKQKARYVSQQQYTKGVVDILRYFEKNYL